MRQNVALCGNELTLYSLFQVLMTLENAAFENIAGKEETAGNLHVLLLKHSFLPYQRQQQQFVLHVVSSGNAFNFDESNKILLFGKK